PGNHLYCYHNKIASLRVVRFQGPKMGKRFYECSFWPVSTFFLVICVIDVTRGYFRWADEVNDEREMRFLLLVKDTKIAELEQEIDMLQMKVKEVKKQNAELEDLVHEVGIECTERRLLMESASSDKKMGFYLNASWVLFAIMFWLV
ncbi:Protein ZGRF1, partial [Bienertia sinuspersici]